MPISKTQELVKALALDFIYNKTFNISILELLCSQQKIHASTTKQETLLKINVIDKGFKLLQQNLNQKEDDKKHKKGTGIESLTQRNLHNMASIFIFNVSAINQHYINDIQNQMAQSTASQSGAVDMSKTFHKDKMAINILKEHLSAYFYTFTEKSQFLQQIVNTIVKKSDKNISESELGLLQTLDYLCVKYSIDNQTSIKIVKLLEKNDNSMEENTSQLIKSDSIKDINKLLFSESRQNEFYQLLQLNSHINYKNLLGIINANYLNMNPSRKIFSTADISGKQTIQGIIMKIIKRIGKNQLFNEKNQDYAPFRMLMFFLFGKHYSVYREFNQIVKSLMNSKSLNSGSSLNNIKKIQKFFRIFVAIENPLFQQTLHFIFNVLASKFSESVALELIKKLILNRFLLNPSFYVMYNEPDQEETKQYVEAANLVRALFYPNKAEQLASKLNVPQISKISSQIIYSLEYCLKKEKDNKSLIDSSNFLYINDKILKGQMQQFYEELKENHTNQRPGAKQGNHVHNIVSDYSLQFSLVKNEIIKNNFSHPIIQNVSEVQLAANTNRTNLKDNQSIRFMYDQLKGQKSHNEMPQIRSEDPQKSPETKSKTNNKTSNKEDKLLNDNQNGIGRISQLARKEHQITHQTRLNSLNLPTDRQIIEELVELRKQYGELRKSIRNQNQGRRARNFKRVTVLNVFSARFNQFKEQVQKQNNSLYVHMTTIA